jgi:hypothetical protein
MAFNEMSDEERDLYLDVLRDGTTPFDRFVARGKMEDVIDIPGPRKAIDRFLFRAVRQTQQDNSTRLIPLLGSAGTGKTHAYWAYKNMEKKLGSASDQADGVIPEGTPDTWNIVYVPSPPAASRILLHVYTCLLDELKADVLKTVAEKLIDKWGGFRKKKLGLFGGQDIEETIQNGIREYPGIFADCVKCLVIFSLDKDRSGLAERWLLGEELDEDELDKLGINSVIESDDICLAMIKIICENCGKTILLYFDELESPYRMHGPEAEQKFLETLKRIYNEVKNLVIIIAVLKEIWPRILETADQALRSRMEQERELQHFQFDDLVLYFAKAMEFFWGQNNLNPPPNPLFPLNEEVLKIIYEKTNGNQRSIIKLIRMFVDKITLDDMSLEDVVRDSQKVELKAEEMGTPIVPIGDATAAFQAASAAVASAAPDKSITQTIEELMTQEEYNIDANPASVASASLKSLKVLGEKFGKEITVHLDYKFTIGKRPYSLPGMIEFNGKKYGMEVPAIKTFNRSGGVAAFYAAKRLIQALTGQIDFGILIVPEGTGGSKYQSLLNQSKEKLFCFEFNDDSAKFLIQQAITQPTQEAYKMATAVFGVLPAYEAPPPPYSTEPKKHKEGDGGDSDEGGGDAPSSDA